MSEIHHVGKIRIMSINDVYAFSPVQGLGGYAEVSTLIEQLRTPHTITVINGDFLGGSPLGEHFQGKCAVDVLNEMNIQYCVIGNHEFDFGNEILKQRIKESSFKWLGSNIKYKETNKLLEGITDTNIEEFTYKSKIDEKEEEIKVKIGLFGVCTLDTPVLSWPGKDIQFKPVVECAIEKNNQLKECDMIIAVTHVDLKEDLQIADTIKNIDLILGGHEHFPYNHITKTGTLIFKTGQNAYWLGVVDYDIQLHFVRNVNGEIIEKRFKFIPSWQMISNHGIPPNPNVLKVINNYIELKEKDDAKIDKHELICVVKHQPLITKTAVVRCGSAQVMNHVADSLWKNFFVNGVSSDLAIINGGVVRGDSVYPPNTKITRGILMHEVPFPLIIVMIEIKGKFIKEALEQHLASYPAPAGSYPHVSGNVKVIVDGSLPVMSRIKQISINDSPMDFEKEYLLTTSQFLSQGGDKCSAYTNGVCVEDDDGSPPKTKIFDILLPYLKNLSELDATLEERLQVI